MLLSRNNIFREGKKSEPKKNIKLQQEGSMSRMKQSIHKELHIPCHILVYLIAEFIFLHTHKHSSCGEYQPVGKLFTLLLLVDDYRLQKTIPIHLLLRSLHFTYYLSLPELSDVNILPSQNISISNLTLLSIS